MGRKASGPPAHVLIPLGTYLRSLREGRGWTLEQASHASGLSISAIAMAETAKRRPSAKALEVLARTYQVDARSMLIKAGILDKRQAFVPILQIDWAFGVMLSDPEFEDADVVRSLSMDFEVRAFVVDLYERRSGKRLLREEHHQALRKWLGIEEFDAYEDSDARVTEEMGRIVERHPTVDWDEMRNVLFFVQHWSPPVWAEQPPKVRDSSNDEEEFLVRGDPEEEGSNEKIESPPP